MNVPDDEERGGMVAVRGVEERRRRRWRKDRENFKLYSRSLVTCHV